MQQLVQFLKTLTGAAWFCFAVGLAGLFCSLYAWLPFASPPEQLPPYLALAAMAAGFVAFLSMARHHLVSWKHRKASQPAVRLPNGFRATALAALVYFLVVFLGCFIAYPHGVDLGPVVGLRIASAAALFFGVFSMGFTQWAGLRVRALQSAP